MSHDSEFTGPLFLQPSNPNDETVPESAPQSPPPATPEYEGLFSSQP
ncbi:hypothetical protein [Rhodococcus sp. NPDC058639]